jgi:glutamyl-tRNA(Gln) amidotransferase subunit E
MGPLMINFVFKPFNEMTEADYETIGFKSGLEIHQQLLTEKKLFCRCPAGRYNKNYDAEILRHMRPTLSEMGVYDGTALMEFKTKKEIIYRINRETVCTYEMDDTPPFLINEEALESAIGIGLLYDCNIVDEIHIARKQYLDGSIPTGFQRTAVYAVDGSIPYKNRKIKIIQMSIEEDSCREISDKGHERIYLADRLGMPLIETVTEPAMKTPNEVAEVAWICTNLVRSTNRVRRGMGAAREDVNVSVEGGTRIEIKGVAKISTIPLLTYNEAMRQWNLLRLREELKSRGITSETFNAKSKDITHILKRVNYAPLKSAVNKNLVIQCVVLKDFAALLQWKTQTDTYFANEISDRVRVIACLTNIPNIIHTDSEEETITTQEWERIRSYVKSSKTDTLVLVWGSESDTETAINEIIIRAKEVTEGIPPETRQAFSDGTNGFERILPGADRMYPDTDLPPKRLEESKIDNIKKWLPEKYWDRQKWYVELGIPEDTIKDLSISPFAKLFRQAVNEWELNPTTIAVALIQFPKRIKKERLDPSIITESMFYDLFYEFKEGNIPKDSIYMILKISVIAGSFSKILLPNKIAQNEVDKLIKEGLYSNNTAFPNAEKKHKYILGKLMKTLRGIVPAVEVANKMEIKYEGAENV